MSFLLFLRGLIGVLLAFAIVTYLMTQSLWTTFVHTVICGVLIQIGYFVAVLFLVRRAARNSGGKLPAEEESAGPKALAREEPSLGRSAGVPRVPRSKHP
ncbi:MAG: exopolysaccharide production repressor protein [Rhizobiaceae bacterium]|jgi:exopolysaccharide production repressor protein